MVNINDRIRQRRTALGLTLLEVADKLGVKEATVQRYESGAIKTIKHEVVVKLAEILKCDPAYLMGWQNEPTKKISQLDEMIRKYNVLDERGKHTVRTVLNVEYDRCMKQRMEPVAAHNDDMSDEQLKLMAEDLDEL